MSNWWTVTNISLVAATAHPQWYEAHTGFSFGLKELISLSRIPHNRSALKRWEWKKETPKPARSEVQRWNKGRAKDFLTFCKKSVKVRNWTSTFQGPLQCLSNRTILPGKEKQTTLVIPSFPSSQGGEAAEPRVTPVPMGADFGGCCRTGQNSPNETALWGKS